MTFIGGKPAKKKPAKKTTTGKKKPLNEFFKLMLDAKKKGLKEFSYKSKTTGKMKTYVRKVSKSPKSGVELVVYKEKK